jgi:hypothetical protein
VRTDRRTAGRADVMKFIVTFRNSANAPKNDIPRRQFELNDRGKLYVVELNVLDALREPVVRINSATLN